MAARPPAPGTAPHGLPRLLRPAALSRQGAHDFVLEPDAAERDELARELGLLALRKLRLAGRLQPEGRADWRLEAMLGATVVQPCVVTLAPVTTRIDEPVTRHFRATPPPEPQGDEVEMPAETDEEPLPERLDLFAVMTEALSLALPDFPRAPGAHLGEAVFAPPGAKPLRDADVHPFAALSALRGKPEGKD